jgi:hypothetical protein
VQSIIRTRERENILTYFFIISLLFFLLCAKNLADETCQILSFVVCSDKRILFIKVQPARSAAGTFFPAGYFVMGMGVS